MKRTRLLGLALAFALAAAAGAEAAQTVDVVAAADGPAERIGDPLCEVDAGFLCMPGENRGRLAVAGSAGVEENGEYYCATEWASILEFDLSDVPVGAVLSATLSLYAMPGYDTAPTVGVFAYAPAPAGVLLERVDLTPATALDTLVPPTEYASFTLDVSAGVREALDAGRTELGLLLAGADDLSGGEVAGLLFAGLLSEQFGLPVPTLTVVVDETVGRVSRSWGAVKSLY
jgi:hypothetical protein